MAVRSALAIEIGGRRVRALRASPARQGLAVSGVLDAEIPSGVDVEDAAALGAWLGEALARAGIPRGRATLAIAREHVALKRLSLPTGDADELPDMTRLAMRREMPFDAEQAVIDFVTVDHGEGHTTVVAAAVPQAVLARARAVAEAAGLTVDRIGLRTLGSAALVRSAAGAAAGTCVLAVDIGADGVEFSVVDGGAIRFSRAASLSPELPAASDVADAVVTEARRTWLSYRIVENACDVHRVALMGEAAVTGPAALPIASMLDVEAEVVDHHPLVEANGVALDGVWPLAGILLEPVVGGETIDFAHPRRAVDVAGRLRRRLLMAAGLLVVVAGALWTAGRRELGGLERRLEAVEARAGALAPGYRRYQRDTFALAHLRRWQEADVRWLDHVLALHELFPPSPEVVLDRWTGTLDVGGVRYDRKAKTWSSPVALTIVVDGEAKDRRVADVLRAALVKSDRYRTASSGADGAGGRRLPYGFTYRLTTDAETPPGGSE